MAATVVEIPKELMIEILTRLPAKSLKRFKCVRKDWRDLITDPDFVANHHLKQIALRHSNKKFNIIVWQYVVSEVQRSNRGFEACFSLLSGGGVEMLITAREEIKRIQTLSVYGHCNGLLCLWLYMGHALWNPTTREFRYVPLLPTRDRHVSRRIAFCTGFGFDSRNNDYKVISFVRNSVVVDGGIRRLVCEVELYSLKSGSWKEIAFPDILPCREIKIPLRPFGELSTYSAPGLNVYYDGVHYWKTDSLDILAFHFADEVFDILQLPDIGVDSWSTCGYELAISNGCLAAIVYPLMSANKCIDLWVKKESSWVKKVSIGPFNEVGVERPLCLLNNGGLLFQGREGGKLFLYNPNTKELKDLELDYASQVIEYVESLVPINGIV